MHDVGFHNSAAYRLGWRDFDDHGDNRGRLPTEELAAYDRGWQDAHDFDLKRPLPDAPNREK